MKQIGLAVLFLLAYFSATAQKSPIKFGEIDMADLKMTIYDKDTSASAVILTDYGEASLDIHLDNIVLRYKRHVRIKILSKEGMSWADGAIMLFHSGSAEERVIGLKASTYNLENGKVVESTLSKENVFRDKFNRNLNIQKFTLPNVKPGSVIEYSYSTVSDFATSFPNWQFQKRIPVRWSEYWAIIPTSLVYEKYMQGYLSITSYEAKSDNYSGINVTAHHWILKDAVAFKPEPQMTTETDYVSKINFQLAGVNNPTLGYREIMGSWAKLNTLLLENEDFGMVILKSGFLKSKALELTAGLTDPMQKIEAIHTYVKQNIEYDGSNDYTAGNVKKVLEAKKGSSGDINLILGSLLDKAGFEVSMILLSTRDHGFIRKSYPVRSQFNYTICSVVVGEKTIFLDATEKYLPLTILPERCLNGEGLVISEKKSRWIEVSSKTKARTVVGADLILDNQGELRGKIVYTRDGYDAFDMRNEYNKKGEETYVKDVLAGRNWKVNKTTFSEMSELTRPAKEYHEVSIEEHASVNGGTIYINPFVEFKEDKNPFTAVTRQFPIDYGTPVEKLYSCKITLPEGFAIDEMPKSKIMILPSNGARFSYNVALLGNSINITSSMMINKSLFLQEEYPALREFYAQVIAKQDEQIVLKRK